MINDDVENLIIEVDALVESRNYRQALEILKKALQTAPNNLEILRYYGKVLTKLRQFPQAFEIFEKIIHINPINVKALRNYGAALAENGKLEQAYIVFEKALIVAPDDVKTLSSYSKALRRKGDNNSIQKELFILERLLELEPENYINYNTYANALVKSKEYDLAFENFEHSLLIKPNNIITLNSYARALGDRGNYDKAFKFFEHTLQLYPDDVITINSYADFLFKKGSYDEASILFKRSLQLDRNNSSTLNYYANLLSKKGSYEESCIYFELSLKIPSNNPTTLSSYLITLNNYSYALVKANNYEKAFEIFERTLKIKPDDVITLNKYAKALFEANQYDRSFELFKRSRKIEPNNIITLNQYANLLVAIKEYHEAFKLFDYSLKIDPNDVFTLNCYANASFLANDYKKAFKLFELLRKIEPENIITLNRYAILLVKVGEHIKALELFNLSLQIEPDNSITLAKYAKALGIYGRALMSETEEYKNACQQFERSLELVFDNYYVYQYTIALENIGEYSVAISWLEKIKLVELPPYNANVIRINLGRLYYRINDKIKGYKYFEEAIANSDDKEETLLSSARSIFATDPYSDSAIKMLQQIAKNSSRYAEALEMLTLNLSEEGYFDMVKTDYQSGLSDTEMLNRGMYHKIANEIGILKGIAYRILRLSQNENSLLSIIKDIEDVFEEINRRRAEQKSKIEQIPRDNYGEILEIISSTAHDISDFVNNELAFIESKTRRAMRKLQPDAPHYAQFDKLLAQLELTQAALSDLKAINEGITIKVHRFKVKKLFEKWEANPNIDSATIDLDIRNGDAEFDGDEEKIKSALNELVENSLKHNFDKPDLQILITSQDIINPEGIRGFNIPGEQKYLWIQFSDNGKGIPGDKKDWIFQPLNTTSAEGKGSGLGLFIIRKTLTKMKGYIREIGYNGARFEIFIPYSKD